MRTGRAEKVVVLTGAASGLGRLTAQALAARGHRVYATLRDAAGTSFDARGELLAWAESSGSDLRVAEIDVTDTASVERGVESILREAGRIDVAINNAGVMNVGVSEAYTVEAAERQFDVNLFGALRLNRAVLPHMRRRRSGLLIQVSSLAGRIVLPFFGLYCASKFAVEALAESYRYELQSFGVDSIIVEPGPFWTRLIERSPGADDLERLRTYGSVASTPTKILQRFTEALTSDDAPDPNLVAETIADLIDRPDERPLRTVVGLDYGVGEINRAAEPIQRALLDALGLGT